MRDSSCTFPSEAAAQPLSLRHQVCDAVPGLEGWRGLACPRFGSVYPMSTRSQRQDDAVNSLNPACFNSCARCARGWASDEPSSRFVESPIGRGRMGVCMALGGGCNQIAFIVLLVVLSKWQWRRTLSPPGGGTEAGPPETCERLWAQLLQTGTAPGPRSHEDEHVFASALR